MLSFQGPQPKNKDRNPKKRKLSMIFVSMGANLDSPQFGSPAETLEAALQRLETGFCKVVRRSEWYTSAPVPTSDQPWYVNGVAEIQTALSPGRLLDLLHNVEDELGRVRGAANAARVIDLDLISYHDLVLTVEPGPIVPHPRLHERAFVLLPLRDLEPHWIDPRTGRSIKAIFEDFPAGQQCRKLDPDKR